MSIKTLWSKLFGIEPEEIIEQPEPEEVIVAPPPISEPSKKERIRRTLGREGRLALIDAFYGTLVDRDPSEGSLCKKKHLHDGWREGFSHPFEFGGRTYDVQKRRDDSREQFEELMAKLNEMSGE